MTQQLDDGRLKPSKTTCFWREIVAAANSLRPRKQTKNADLKKTKTAFLYEAVQLLLTNIFTLIFDRVLDHKLVQKVRVILFYVCMQ